MVRGEVRVFVMNVAAGCSKVDARKKGELVGRSLMFQIGVERMDLRAS